MKSYTDEEIDAKLRQFEDKEARGELKFDSWKTAQKKMKKILDKHIKIARKHEAERIKKEAKSAGRRASQAV